MWKETLFCSKILFKKQLVFWYVECKGKAFTFLSLDALIVKCADQFEKATFPRAIPRAFERLKIGLFKFSLALNLTIPQNKCSDQFLVYTIWRLVHSLSVKVSGKIQIPYPLKAFRVTYPTPQAWKIVKCPGYAGGSMLQVWIDCGEPGHFLDLLIYDMHTAGINYVQSTMCGDRQRDMKNCHSREINVLCHGMSVGWRNTQPTHKSHIHISS